MKAPAAAACLTLAATGIVFWLSPAPPKTRVIRALAFRSEGRFLAAGDRNGDIEIRLTASWEVVKQIRLESGGLNALAFSPDGRVLAVAGRSLALWGTAGWNKIAELGTAIYGTVRFSPDGREFATVNASERIEIWDTGTGKRVQTLCCMALYGDLAFSPDGRMLAAGGHWPSLWDYRAGRRLRRLVETREPTFGPVCFGRGGRVLATGSQDGRARVWDAATGKEILSSKPRGKYVETLAFHPDGTLLAYGVRDGPVWVWDTTTGAETMVAPVAASDICFSPDGESLVYAAPGGSIHSKSHIGRVK